MNTTLAVRSTLTTFLNNIIIDKNDSIDKIIEILYELMYRIEYKYFNSSLLCNVKLCSPDVHNILCSSVVIHTYMEILKDKSYSMKEFRMKLKNYLKSKLCTWLLYKFDEIITKQSIQYYSEQILLTDMGEKHISIIKLYYKNYLTKNEFQTLFLSIASHIQTTGVNNKYLNELLILKTDSNLNDVVRRHYSNIEEKLIEKIFNLNSEEAIRLAIIRLIHFIDKTFTFHHFLNLIQIPYDNVLYKKSQYIFNAFLREFYSTQANNDTINFYSTVLKQISSIIESQKTIDLFLNTIKTNVPFQNFILKLFTIYFNTIERTVVVNSNADDDDDDVDVDDDDDDDDDELEILWYTNFNNNIIYLSELEGIFCLLASNKSNIKKEFCEILKKHSTNELYKRVFENYTAYNF